MVLLQQAVVDAYINSERLFVMKRTVIGIVFTCVGTFIVMMCLLSVSVSGARDLWAVLPSLGLTIPFCIGMFLFLVGILTTFIEYFKKQ